MANILPSPQDLPEILEDSYESFTFAAELTSEETLKSIKIIDHSLPENILVVGATFSGTFSDLFELPLDSMKYRQGLEYGTASKFSELPEKGTADLYSIIMPGEMIKYFNIIVELVYTDVTLTDQTITKSYIQPVRGNRYKFISQFLNYVR